MFHSSSLLGSLHYGVIRCWDKGAATYATETIVVCGAHAWRYYEAMNISSENTDAIPSHFSCWSIYRTGNQIILIVCALNRWESGQRGRKQKPHQNQRKFVLFSYLTSGSCLKNKIGVISKNKFACKKRTIIWCVWKNYEKRPLIHHCPYVLSAWHKSASSGRIFIKFDVFWGFSGNLQRKLGFH